MKFTVYTDGSANAPKVTTVVAENARAAKIAVETQWEMTKVLEVRLDKQ